MDVGTADPAGPEGVRVPGMTLSLASQQRSVATAGGSASGPRGGGLIPMGPGLQSPTPAVAVGPGMSPAGAEAGSDIARAIEERVIAALRRGPVDAYGLSPREHEVLLILAEGRTDRDIAARLFISERTVHVHVRRILAKLRVSSRTEAAGLAIRTGLVPGPALARTGSPAHPARERMP